MKNLYIAFDLGAESGRCVIGELERDNLHLSEVHRFATPFIMCMGHYFWDVLKIYEEMIIGLQKASVEFGSVYSGISVDTCTQPE